MLSEMDEKLRKKAKQFYESNKKHIGLILRVAVLMSFAIAIGVNCLYFEDYIILTIYVIGIGIILFFIPLQKIKDFLDLEE